MKRTIITLLVLFLIVQVSFGQNYTKVEVIKDLEFLVESIEKYNPGLYRYNPNFKPKVQHIVNSVADDLSTEEYFKLISRVAGLSNEGHLKLTSSNQYPFKGILDNSCEYIPLTVKIISGRLYVLNSFSPQQVLSAGDEVLSINGKPTESILKSIYKCTPSDGNIISNLELLVSSGFPWMYFSYVEQPDYYTIKYKNHTTSEISTIKIEALNRSEQIANLALNKNETKNSVDKSVEDFYEFEIKDGYAHLILKTFDYKLIDLYDLDADDFYEGIFSKLNENNIRNLIIDLRNNTGGRFEFANEIVPFIQKNSNDDFLNKSISWKGKEKEYKFPKVNKLAFKGKIITLVNGRTYSSGAVLARYLNEYANALIVGEETGSRYEGFAAGSQQNIILPNSKFKIGIPRYLKTFPISKKQETQNRGLLPNIEVRNDINDFVRDIDRPFLEAIKHIEN